MIRHGFVVTSAINSKFGVYSPAARLQQTLTTLDSIRARAPGSKIIVMECTGTPLTEAQSQLLEENSDLLLDFSTDKDVHDIYNSTDNWDIVKNSTEIMCFGRTLKMCLDDGDFADCDRIHKMSGRYILNEKFDLGVYSDHPNRIVIGQRIPVSFLSK